jgi:electron transport complex protein RnfE
MMGLGFALVLFLLGATREIIGTGGIFANMDLLFGQAAKDWAIGPIQDYPGFLVAILPPGAFIITGLIIALKNIIDKVEKERAAAKSDAPTASSRRVRVTGNIS